MPRAASAAFTLIAHTRRPRMNGVCGAPIEDSSAPSPTGKRLGKCPHAARRHASAIVAAILPIRIQPSRCCGWESLVDRLRRALGCDLGGVFKLLDTARGVLQTLPHLVEIDAEK